jgi:phosphoglycerol transferase MdoB-like AlkP superfamily enzyme
MIYRCRQSIGDIGYGLLAAYVASIVGSILYRAVTRSFDFWDGVRRFVQIAREIALAAPWLTALVVGFPVIIFLLWRLLLLLAGKPTR